MFDRRLAAYSATAGAVLAFPNVGSADFHAITGSDISFNGTPISQENPPGIAMPMATGSIVASVALQGIPAGFSLYAVDNPNGSVGGWAGLFAVSSPTANLSPFLLNFPNGDPIAGSHFGSRGTGYLVKHTAGGAVLGNFVGGASAEVVGYLGFKFSKSAQTYYGWLRASVFYFDNKIISFGLKGNSEGVYGAWGDPAITAGAVPEPSVAALGGLGLLALGASGVREMRRRLLAATN